jgi:photosystem II stability/assembly factor-like uncharacterized protein
MAAPGIVTLGPFGGDVRSLAVHPAKPDRFFLGTADGQIYVSENRGGSWRLLTPGVGRRDLVVDNLVFHPQNPDTLFAATWALKNDQGWLFRSDNGGNDWREVSLGPYSSAIRAIAIAPSDPNVMALGISEGVLLSLDGGRSWDRISRGYRSLHNVESLAFDPVDPQTLYVGTWHLGFKTSNGGKKWEPIQEGMITDSDMFSLLVNPADPNVLYSSACTGIYRSSNAGALWTKLRNGLPKDANRTRTLLIDPVDPTIVYAGTTVGLFVSRDEGANWRLLVPGLVINAIAVHPGDHSVVLVGSDDAGVLRSVDRGETFEAVNTGFIHRQIADLAVSPDHPSSLYAAVTFDRQYGGFFFTDDHGATWRSYNDGLPQDVVDSITCVTAPAGAEVYLGTKAGVFAGVPGEKPWRPIACTERLRMLDISVGPDANALYLGAEGGIFQLALKPEKLQRLTIPVYKGEITTVLYDRDSGNLFAGGDTGVFRSTDAGKTWAMKVRGLPYSAVHSLERSGNRILCGTRQGLFYSDDYGESWTSGKGVYPLDIMTIRSNPARPNEVFAADFLVGYLFMSRDAGSSWEVLNMSSPRSRISRLVFARSGELLAGTLSEGVYLIEQPASGLASGGGQ